MLVSARALAPEWPAKRPAVRAAGTELSFGALRQAAAGLAREARGWPRRGGATPYVAVVSDWTPAFVGAFLGVASSGWAVAVLDPTWSATERDAAIAQLDPCAVLVADGLGAHPAGDWSSQAVPDGGWTVWTRADARERVRPPGPDEPFYAGFTSGSAGRPKVFVRSHRSWWESFEGFSRVCPGLSGVVLVPGPLSSSHFLFGALHALHVGATVELTPAGEISAAGLARRLTAGPVAAVYVVPTMLAHVAGVPGRLDDPGSVFCAGARLDAAVVARARSRFPTSRLVEYYGASELSFVAIREEGDGTPAGSVGAAFPGVEISIRDDEDRPVPAGRQGVIFVRSGMVFSGYRGGATASGTRRLREGWVTVGDRGHVDGAGHLWVAGRGSALIITGGANVQPEEVEEVVASAPGVRECAVIGLPDARWGEIVCAAVVLHGAGEVRRAAVRAHVASVLARHKRPRRYMVVDGPLPVGRTGKVDRGRVRDLVLDGGARELIG